MAQAAVHAIKDIRPSRDNSPGSTEPAVLKARTDMAGGFLRIEGPINDLYCMAQLAADNAASFDFKRADGDDQNQLLFTIYHLHELIMNLRGQYYGEFEK